MDFAIHWEVTRHPRCWRFAAAIEVKGNVAINIGFHLIATFRTAIHLVDLTAHDIKGNRNRITCRASDICLVGTTVHFSEVACTTCDGELKTSMYGMILGSVAS